MSNSAEISALFIVLNQKFDEQFRRGELSLSQMASQIRQLTDQIACRHIQEYAQHVDCMLRESEERKRNYTIEKRRQQKTMATTAGPVVYERPASRTSGTATMRAWGMSFWALRPIRGSAGNWLRASWRAPRNRIKIMVQSKKLWDLLHRSQKNIE